MVELAGKMLLSGKTVSQIVDQLINLRNNNRTYMLISDIYQLMKDRLCIERCKFNVESIFASINNDEIQ